MSTFLFKQKSSSGNRYALQNDHVNVVTIKNFVLSIEERRWSTHFFSSYRLLRRSVLHSAFETINASTCYFWINVSGKPTPQILSIHTICHNYSLTIFFQFTQLYYFVSISMPGNILNTCSISVGVVNIFVKESAKILF